MRPRICMVVERFYPQVGGSETQALNLSKSLIRLGVPLFVLTRRTLLEMAPEQEVQGVRVYRVLPAGTGILSLVLASFSFSWFLFRKRKDYDIIHCHGFGWAGPVSSIMGLLLGKKTIVKVATAGDVSGMIVGKKKLLPVINRIRLFSLRLTTRLICISSEIHDELRNKGFSESRLVQLPNGVDLERFSHKTERKRLLPEKGLNVLFSGRMVYRKGIDVLFKAFAGIAKEFPEVSLHILGSGRLQAGDQFEDELRSWVRDNNLESRITFHGNVDNVEDYLREADIFAFPSRHEGLPNALLEAMSCGLPVVATRIGGVVDVVNDGENGVIVEADDPEGLCVALGRLIKSRELREQLGKKARRSIELNYSMSFIAGEYVKLYDLLLRERGSHEDR